MSNELINKKQELLDSLCFTKYVGSLYKLKAKSGINLVYPISSPQSYDDFERIVLAAYRKEGGPHPDHIKEYEKTTKNKVDVNIIAGILGMDLSSTPIKQSQDVVPTQSAPPADMPQSPGPVPADMVQPEPIKKEEPKVKVQVPEEPAPKPVGEVEEENNAIVQVEEEKPKTKRKRATKAEMAERKRQTTLAELKDKFESGKIDWEMYVDECAKLDYLPPCPNTEQAPEVDQPTDAMPTPEAPVEELKEMPQPETPVDAPETAASMVQEETPDNQPEQPVENKKLESDGMDCVLEETDATYLAELLQSVPAPLVRRITINGDRFYFTVEENSVVIHASATTLIADGYVDRSRGLTDWLVNQRVLGKDPEFESRKAADLGTIMHYLYGLFLMGRKLPLIPSKLRKVIKDSDLRIEPYMMELLLNDNGAMNILIEDILSFAKFCKDYNVKPLAIEKVLVLDNLLGEFKKEDDKFDHFSVASPIDAIVEMDCTEKIKGFHGEVYQRATGEHKAGEPKETVKEITRRIHAILDFKSGGFNRKGNFYPEHAFQLELYRRMVEYWYGDLIKIEKLYNFMPKSISASSAYYLRDQTNNPEAARKSDVVFAQGAINHIQKPKVVKYFTGEIDIESGDIQKCIKEVDLKEELERMFVG